MERIYFDNNATTPLDPRVFEAMLQDLKGPPANPSSIHWFGRQARGLLSRSRQTVAQFFHADPDEIIFTSGGTESLNLLLKGLQGHVITSNVEHSAVYRTLESLEAKGLSATYLPAGLWGACLVSQIAEAIRPQTTAIILAASNGETGVKTDIEAVAALAKNRGIPLFLDAVSYVGKELLVPGASAIAISGHKFHGPKGIGALYVQKGLKILPLLTGGHQERLLRSGTENLPGILGLAKALQILQEEQAAITAQLNEQRLFFEQELLKSLPDLLINGQGPRISNTSNIAFLGVDGETLLMQLDLAGIAASHGSACSAGALEPSRVLTNMGLDKKTARSSLRFSFSRMNTKSEIASALEITVQLVKKLRALTTQNELLTS